MKVEMLGDEAWRERPIDSTSNVEKKKTRPPKTLRLAHLDLSTLGLSFFFPPNTPPSTQPKKKKKQNRKNTPERLEIKKYNKFLKRHTVHKEIK